MKKFLLMIIASALLCSSAWGASLTYDVTADTPIADVIAGIQEEITYIEEYDPEVEDDPPAHKVEDYKNITLVITEDLVIDEDSVIDINTEGYYDNLENITIDGGGHTIAINSDPDDPEVGVDIRCFILNNSGITLTLKNITIDGAGVGGGIDVIAGNLVIDESVSFTNNANSSSLGGALRITGGTVTINNSANSDRNAKFTGNTTAADGGAIAISGGTLDIKGSPTFTGNSAVNGGAVSISGGTITFAASPAFTGNTASSGGGAVYFSGGTAKFSGTASFSSNSADIGGAVYSGGSSLTFSGAASFSGNGANTSGGAIYYSGSSSSPFSLTGANFDGSASPNYAQYGGAIYLASGTISLTDCTFTANSADISGGAVYISGGTLAPVSGNTFAQNKAVNGGALFIANSSNAVLSVPAAGFTIGDTASSSANTAENGGAIYLSSSGSLSLAGPLTLSHNSAANGGGLYAETVTQLNSLADSLDLTGNTADYGGGLYLSASSSNALSLNSSSMLSFSGNTAYYDGGAIYTLHSNVTIDGIEISYQNTAENGGGFLRSGGTTTITGATISNQTALFGGAVYSVGTLTVSNSTFTNNSSNGTDSYQGGGALFVSGDATITGSTFSNNTHTNSGTTPNGGGAVYVNNGTLTLIDSTFTNNRTLGGAASRGGAVYANNATVGLTNCLLQTNSSSGNGGALMFAGHCSSSIKDSTFIDNPSSENGGAIYAQGTLTVEKSYFYNNRSLGNGGAVYFNQHNDAAILGSISVVSSMFTENTAGVAPSSGQGGALYLAPDIAMVNYCSFTLNKSSSNNSDSFGGALYLDTSAKTPTASTTYVKNSVFFANEAVNGTSNYGGGIYTKGDMSLLMNTIVNNSAANRGGGLYVDSGTVAVTGNILVGNNSAVGRDAYAEGTITSRGYNRVGVYAKGSDTSWRDDVTGAKPNDQENAGWSAATFFGGPDGSAEIELVSSYLNATAPTVGSTLYSETVYLLALPLNEIDALTAQYRATNIIPFDQRNTLGIDQYDIWGSNRFAGGLDITIGAYYSADDAGSESGEVTAYNIRGVKMSGIPNTLKYPGQTASLIAMISYTNGRSAYGVPYDAENTTLNQQERVTWSSSNSSAVKVDKYGNITALRETNDSSGVVITVTTERTTPSGEQATDSQNIIVTNNNGYEYMNISPEYYTYLTQNVLPQIFEYDISAAIADKNPSTVRSSTFQRNFSAVWSAAATQITDLTTSTPTIAASTSSPAVSGMSASKRAGVSINYQNRTAGELFPITYSWTFTGSEIEAVMGYDMSSQTIGSALAEKIFDVFSIAYQGNNQVIPVLGEGGISGQDAYDSGALEISKADGNAGLHVDLTVYLGNMAVTGNSDGAQIVKSSGTARVLVVPDGVNDGAIAGSMWMFQPAGTKTDTETETKPDPGTDPGTDTHVTTGGSGGGGGCDSVSLGSLGLLGAIVLFLKRRQ